jgi:hypothetical protein
LGKGIGIPLIKGETKENTTVNNQMEISVVAVEPLPL